MPARETPPPQDELDEALAMLLEYLALSGMVEGELNAAAPSLNTVIVALLACQEAQGRLSPYRRSLLERIRAAGEREAKG